MEGATGATRDAAFFEVSTGSNDALRARLTVVGELTSDTITLLASAVDTHLTAGRRYLRIDVSAAAASDAAVLDGLTELHDRTTRLGGMLVFESLPTPTPSPLGRHIAALRDRG